MNGSILAIATAVPKPFSLQEQILGQILNLYPFDDAQKKYVKKVYQNSGIVKRHHVIDGAAFFANRPNVPQTLDVRPSQSPGVGRSELARFSNTSEALIAQPLSAFASAENQSLRDVGRFPGMSARNEVYKKEAPLLAKDASLKAIEAWGQNPQEITHVISISCTGVYIPGIEFSLIDSLGLNRSIYRLGINFMGCFGAFKGMHVANAFAKENPKARILVVCTELCSLHLQETQDEDNLLSGSLFADGASSFIIGCDPRGDEKPIWEIKKQISLGLENSTGQMTWEATDTGYKMGLSSFVALSIAHGIKPFTQNLLGTVEKEECDFAIHPGGKAILQVIQKKLGLLDSQVKQSYETLADFGNMSSATFPFVLEKLYKQGNLNSYCAGFGFGPGLSMEGILLKSV